MGSDPYLARLVREIDQRSLPASSLRLDTITPRFLFTLHVGGLTVTGYLASRDKYRFYLLESIIPSVRLGWTDALKTHEWETPRAAEWETALDSWAKNEEAEEGPEPKFIHLRDVHTSDGRDLDWWRGRLDAVDGFSVEVQSETEAGDLHLKRGSD